MNNDFGKDPSQRDSRDEKIGVMTKRKVPKRKKLTFHQRMRIWELAVTVGLAVIPVVARLVLLP